jgi:uncharacterized protein YukE
MPEPKPANYDNAGMVIQVDPDAMYTDATTTMRTHGDSMAEHISSINDTWNGLKLGWMGRTADEAQSFNDQWNAAIKSLFGTEEDPSSGVLNKIEVAVHYASVNYGVAEDVVVKMFNQIAAAIGNPSGSPDSGPKSHTDGPITETFPT